VLLYKNFAAPQLPWLEFMSAFSLLTGVLCAALFIASLWYFRERTKPSSVGGGRYQS
jgi:hypothetical protein